MDPSEWLAAPFRGGAALRQRRFFHPDGVLATGSLERVAPQREGLPLPSSQVVARLSKAAGTPGALPDAVGLAVRVAAPRWDLLLVSAGSGVLGRALGLHPVISWSGLTLSTLMPLRYRERTWWLRARLVSPVNGRGVALADVADRIAGGTLRFLLDQAHGAADFHPLAHLTLDRTAPPDSDVSFDPVVHTAPGVALRPRWLTELRALAYRGSRQGRDAESSRAVQSGSASGG